MTRIIKFCTALTFAGLIINSHAAPMASVALSDDELITRIAFGSCMNAALDTSILDRISATRPDVFLLIGDNVYADDEKDDPELASLRVAYNRLSESKPFTRLRNQVPLLVTWDDHDYGLNDAGGDWPHRFASQALYLDTWAIPSSDPRTTRDGIYFSRIVGPPGKRVQLILLDTRFFRSPLTRAKTTPPHGRYTQSSAPDATLLGEAQWQWLEAELGKQAEIRIIASSIQVLSEGHNWEAWHLFPAERDRLLETIKQTGAEDVILISGDRHSSAIYRDADRVGYPLWEVTSSSLNVPLSSFIKNIKTEPGPLRVGEPYYDANFGLIEIDWQSRRVIMQVRDEHGRPVQAANVKMSSLKQ